MPTGYTAGIVDGTIKTFKDYAKLCMRAFGALIHMRDENLKEEYKPRTPDKHYLTELNISKDKLKIIENYSDKEIIKLRTESIKNDIEYYIDRINKVKTTKELADKILMEAKSYQEPTNEHVEIKKFMIQQLEDTINFDLSPTYEEQELMSLKHELENLDANEIRKNLIKAINEDIEYYSENYDKEVERCKNSNEWVETFLKSIG